MSRTAGLAHHDHLGDDGLICVGCKLLGELVDLFGAFLRINVFPQAVRFSSSPR